jgi:MarR family transcriptional regulator, organic hydroperoxide resistance regulator
MKKTAAQKQATQHFRAIYAAAKNHFKEVEVATGLSSSKLWILQHVSRNEGIGITELSKLLMIHVSTCSLLVDKAIAKGLLIKKRCDIDSRRMGLTLSDEAKEILASTPKSSEGLLSKSLKKLNEEDMIALSVLLDKVVKLMHADKKKFKMPVVDD